MRFLSIALAVVLGVLPALAEKPKVVVPPEIDAGEIPIVLITAKVEGGKGVEFYPLDPGISILPFQLKDEFSAPFYVSKPGRYRVLVYSGNADGASTPVVTTIKYKVDAVPAPGDPPPVKPDPIDPKPPAPSDKLYFLLVRADGPDADGVEKCLKLPAWAELWAKGHAVKTFEKSKVPAGFPVPADLPKIVTLRILPSGKSEVVKDGIRPMPKTDDEVRGLLK